MADGRASEEWSSAAGERPATRRSSEREPADSLRDKSTATGGRRLPSLAFALDSKSIVTMSSPEHDLTALLRKLLAEGAYGLTLRTGEHPVIHSDKGSHLIEGTCPTSEDILSLVRRITKSRHMRELRERGVVSFMHTFESHFQLLGGARMEKDQIRLELRRMTGQPDGTAANGSQPTPSDLDRITAGYLREQIEGL